MEAETSPTDPASGASGAGADGPPSSAATSLTLLLGSALSLADRLAELAADADPERNPEAAAAVAADTSGPADEDASLRHLAIGIAIAGTERAVSVTRTLGSAAAAVSGPFDRLSRIGPLGAVRARVERDVAELTERGRRTEIASRAQARLAFAGTVESVSGSPVIDDVVNDVVGRALDPILATALPKVLDDLGRQPDLLVPLVNSIVAEALDPILDLALPQVLGDVAEQPDLILPLVQAIVDEALEPLLREALPRVFEVLNEDPGPIRALMRDQSTGIAVEMTDTVRVRAASADEKVDRIVARVLRRKAVPLDALETTEADRRELPAAPADGPPADSAADSTADSTPADRAS